MISINYVYVSLKSEGLKLKIFEEVNLLFCYIWWQIQLEAFSVKLPLEIYDYHYLFICI